MTAPPTHPLRDATGKNVRLFDLFRGPHFTLLRFVSHTVLATDHSAAANPLIHVHSVVRGAFSSLQHNEVADHEGHTWKTYGLDSDTLLLVRPDGYIAFIGDAASAVQIEKYLKRILA